MSACLCRRDSKTLVLRNSTPLPVAWQLRGLEKLGEDFSVSLREGIVGPRAEFGVHLYFKATKPLSIKKTIQLEVRGTVPSLAEPGRGISPALLGMETVLGGHPAKGAKG